MSGQQASAQVAGTGTGTHADAPVPLTAGRARAVTDETAGLPAAVFDPARLAAVHSTGLLDTGPEEDFDALTRLAAQVTSARRAFVTVVDDRRSFWKSCVGTPDLPVDQRQNAVHESPCHILIGTNQPLISDDARHDPRIRDVPAVTQLGIGAWAGVPVHDRDGHVIGGLCVVADEPRTWTDHHVQTLHTLAAAAGAQVKLRQELHRTRTQAAELDALARAEAERRAEAEQRAAAAAELAERMRTAAAAHAGTPRPDRCQLGGTDGCTEPADIKIADSWGDSAWGCRPTPKKPSSTSGQCSSPAKNSAASPPTSTADRHPPREQKGRRPLSPQRVTNPSRRHRHAEPKANR